MEIGMIGLGRMGGNMTIRLIRGGHKVVAYDVNKENIDRSEADGAVPAYSLEEMVNKLPKPRVLWMMVPAGKPVTETVRSLIPHLAPGDIIIDGGNSYFRDSLEHADMCAGKDIRFMDVGVSGGVWGLEEGYCLMAGGDKELFHHIEPILATLAPEGGYAYVGPIGAGHYVKMVHNGIEYAMLEGYGEGFELLRCSQYDIDLEQVASLWLHGSVVRSWLLELARDAFKRDPDLSEIKGYVEDSGEGRWTVQEAINNAVPVPAIADALFARFRSREIDSFTAKVIAALRHEFGGHRVEMEPGVKSEEAKAA